MIVLELGSSLPGIVGPEALFAPTLASEFGPDEFLVMIEILKALQLPETRGLNAFLLSKGNGPIQTSYDLQRSTSLLLDAQGLREGQAKVNLK